MHGLPNMTQITLSHSFSPSGFDKQKISKALHHADTFSGEGVLNCTRIIYHLICILHLWIKHTIKKYMTGHFIVKLAFSTILFWVYRLRCTSWFTPVQSVVSVFLFFFVVWNFKLIISRMWLEIQKFANIILWFTSKCNGALPHS